MNEHPNDLIIGSDQILVTSKGIINKPQNIIQAKDNLNFLSGKEHSLISSVYVIRSKKFFFEETKEALLFFRKISRAVIEEYVKENKKTALSSVGSYKIEQNKKYNFIKVIKGDQETIIGFPLKKLIKRLEKI